MEPSINYHQLSALRLRFLRLTMLIETTGAHYDNDPVLGSNGKTLLEIKNELAQVKMKLTLLGEIM